MKIKIVSNGSPQGTSVIDAETGELIDNVTGIELSIDGKEISAWIQIRQPILEIDGLRAGTVRTEPQEAY